VEGRVAVLWHERQSPQTIGDYVIDWLAQTWRAAGTDTVHVFGVETYVPADVVIVHVDVSVVPDHYLRFANRYPIALNGRLRDIRKTTFSELQLTRSSEYAGKVIVKTNRNHGGRPERRLSAFAPIRQGPARWQRRKTTQWSRSRSLYRIYDHLPEVPTRYFVDPRFIVEKLLSEEKDGLFWTRYLSVLGTRVFSVRISSDQPIVTGHENIEAIETDPRLVAFARKIGLDYGKIDYVVHDGETYVLDVNKTTGSSQPPVPDIFMACRRHRADAIYDYLPGGALAAIA
jgi:hypothetical protein